MRKKVIGLVILIILILGFAGCGESKGEKSFKDGQKELTENNYEKALEDFKLSKNEDYKEASIYYNSVDRYLKAKESYNENRYQETLDLLNKIEDINIDKFNSDITKLKSDAEKEIETTKKIKDIKKLIEEENLDRASKMIESLDGDGLNSTEKDEVKNLKEKLEKIKKDKKEEEERKNKIQLEKNKQKSIISRGMSILHNAGIKNVHYEGIKQQGLNIDGFKGKLYYFEEDVEDSPNEYYFNQASDEMVYLNQGMYFIVNKNYKNITPKSSSTYDSSKEFREYLIGKNKNN